MCSVINIVKPAKRALALTPRLRPNTEGWSCAAVGSRRFDPGVRAGVDPLRGTFRSYCSRMAQTQGLLFRQVGYAIFADLRVHPCNIQRGKNK